MRTTKKNVEQQVKLVSAAFVENLWQENWQYIKTVIDVVREPVLILDKDLHVMAANESFYRTFQVEQIDTEARLVYELGNGQWNIPALRKLLEDILPQNTFFKGFEVTHLFPCIGRKVMILNAREIRSTFIKDIGSAELFPPIMMLAMEDATDMMMVAETLAGHASQMEARLVERTQTLENHIGQLEKEIDGLKKADVA